MSYISVFDVVGYSTFWNIAGSKGPAEQGSLIFLCGGDAVCNDQVWFVVDSSCNEIRAGSVRGAQRASFAHGQSRLSLWPSWQGEPNETGGKHDHGYCYGFFCGGVSAL